MKYAAPTTAPKKGNDFANWLLDELRHISDAFSEVETDSTTLKQWAAELNKLFDGLIIFADGTNFDPGLGRGFYGRHDAAWHKLDETGPFLADPGSLILTGAEAGFVRSDILDAQPGSLVLTGAIANVFMTTCGWDQDGQWWDNDDSIWHDCFTATPGILTLTGADVTFSTTSPLWNDDPQPWNLDASNWNA